MTGLTLYEQLKYVWYQTSWCQKILGYQSSLSTLVWNAQNTHLRSYCNKMAEVIRDDKLLIYFFQDSLAGSALSWYMRLDSVRIRSWRDLVEAFLKQYKFNMEIAPDRTSLMSMEKRSQESVRAYAQRWRDEAMHVQPPLIETEMVTLETKTRQVHLTHSFKNT